MLGLGFALTNFGYHGGVVDTPDLSGSSAAALLAAYGGEGFSMIFDSTAPSLKIADSTTPSNDWDSDLGDGYSVQDFFKSRSFTSYSGPVSTGKRLMQADGYIKPVRHNLIKMSNKFAATTWTKTNINDATFSATTTGPDGNATSGQKLEENTTSGAHRIYLASNITTTPGVAYTFSIYAKEAERERLFVEVYNSAASNGATVTFDVAGEQIGVAAAGFGAGAFSNLSASVGAADSYGFKRCVLTFTTDTDTEINAEVWLDNDTGTAASSISYAGTNGNGLYIYGAQINAGSQALAYVSSEAHNLVIQSRTLGTSWTATDVTVGSNATTSPDGTTSAESLTEGVAGTALLRSTAFTVPASSTVTAYFYLKTSTATWVRVTLADGSDTNGLRQWFNLSTGAKGTLTAIGSGTATSSNITACGNGWYLCEITGVCSTSTSLTMSLSSASADASNTRVNSVVYYADCAQATLSSSAQKVVTTTAAAQYLPHFDIPVEFNSSDGTVRALRREEARTNNLLSSNTIANAEWLLFGATKVGASAEVSPEGVANAYQITTGSTGGAFNSSSALYQLVSMTSGTTYTFSVFVRSVSGSVNFRIGISDVASASSDSGDITATTTWQRFEVTHAATATGNGNVSIRCDAAGNDVNLIIYATQHEAGSTASSPIITVSAAVTRAADVIECSNRVFGWTDATLTAYTKATLQSIAATQRLIAIDDGTANETHQLSIVASTGVYNSTTVDGGVTQANASTGNAVTAGTAFKAATSIKVNDLAAGLNNGTLATDTSITMPTVHTIRFGAGLSAAAPSTGEFHEFLIVPTDLSDAQLGSLTTL